MKKSTLIIGMILGICVVIIAIIFLAPRKMNLWKSSFGLYRANIMGVLGQSTDNANARITRAIGDSVCPTLVKPDPYPKSYLGPLIDTHIHIAPIPDGPIDALIEDNDQPTLGSNVTVADYVCMMDTEGTKSVFAFFPVWDPIVKDFIDVVDRTMMRYPGRFVPFIMPPDHDDRK